MQRETEERDRRPQPDAPRPPLYGGLATAAYPPSGGSSLDCLSLIVDSLDDRKSRRPKEDAK